MQITPAYFENLVQSPCSDLLAKAMENGRIPVGYTCSYVPEVLLSVGDLVPVRVHAPGVYGTEMADIYLSGVTCSYIRSLLEFALDDQYEFLEGWVFAASCDHLRRLCDNLDYLLQPDFIHILDVPHRIGDAALAWYTDELGELTRKLAGHFHADFSETALAHAIRDHNEFAALVSEIGDLRKAPHPPISGSEFHALMMAAQTSPKTLLMDPVRRFRDALSQKALYRDYRARLLVAGGQINEPAYIQAIESVGGLVVADHFCTGSIPGLTPISMNGSPLDAIAAHYLGRTACPRMMENFNDRVDAILAGASAYNADGVILEHIKFCDIWGIEAAAMAGRIKAAGIPVLNLEREYSATGEGQLKTRVQAFIESMGK
ncbi:benzoyl-CoA reductase/2-hydroxyglutaryl-CoA dehydratase subunit BcrC/BadD/HgdB [Desulfosalsimonas propionicica]|uniref:Benzoyl-CoA reductase/2-hydroxyglutaryl-CoA dehydratase subunit BcrC/BadD/HgdB n=1 Tax=Desulfosalsimonas propionicica TaxID=332175 RepID=A0A7W0C6V1_9BACT|nr:2-hydroxyacyl-CoA dehydratase family protein [Desulfosalsimonas propionicica]MBA2880212.1 benzoyl-CoA reductase/2-hydroxyglutaryl-CoA dehydratase subunit BcrC/BadD/HgdB [Desulfosalsimonas propionicica]